MKNDIINLAAVLKKPSETTILDIIRNAIQTENYALGEMELAQLYSFFIPPIPAKTKNNRLWVGRAAAHNHTRNCLNYTYYDGTRLIGSDGNRVHWIKTDGMEKCYYIPATMDAVSNQGDYPDIDKVTPSTYAAERGQYRLKDFDLVEMTFKIAGVKKPTITLCYTLPNGIRLAKKYVTEAYNRDKEMVVYLPEDENPTSIKLESIDGKRHCLIAAMHN
jgi:hypothetical protein